MTHTSFLKMHGLGNDFVVIDTRGTDTAYDEATAMALANRRTGIGCDQFITIEDSATADVRMGIINADGSRVAACGNATRCVGRLILAETGTEEISIETDADILYARAAPGTDRIAVNMGRPRLDAPEIPLSQDLDTLSLPISLQGYSDPVGVNMGNPHMVFFVDNAEAVPLAEIGPTLEHHTLYPERANVEFAQVIDRQTIRMRVWERGAGITQACGTGACAVLVAAVRRGLVDRAATLHLDGGPLHIAWDKNDHVWMTGATTLAYEGQINLDALVKQSA